MRSIVVVYESMFGSTELAARCVAEGIAQVAGSEAVVEVHEVGEAPASLDGPDLLVIGAPTHAFGLSRPESRRQAAEQTDEPLVSPGRGVREWLDEVSLPAGLPVAVFDTRMTSPRILELAPHATGAIGKRLKRRRVRMVQPAASFVVAGGQGPLADGEDGRARDWGRTVAAAVLTPAL